MWQSQSLVTIDQATSEISWRKEDLNDRGTAIESKLATEQNRSVANVQSDDLWPSRMHAATHILQEKTHACDVQKRHYFRVHVSLGSAETLVRRGGIINHHSIAYSLSNISAKNYRNWLIWVESIVCNISVVFLGHSVAGVCLPGAIFLAT